MVLGKGTVGGREAQIKAAVRRRGGSGPRGARPAASPPPPAGPGATAAEGSSQAAGRPLLLRNLPRVFPVGPWPHALTELACTPSLCTCRLLPKVSITPLHLTCVLWKDLQLQPEKSQNTKASRQPLLRHGVPAPAAPAPVTCLGCVLHAPAKLLCVSLVLLPDLFHLLVAGGHLLLQGPLQGCQLPLPQPQLLLYPLLPLQDLFQKLPRL